MYVDIIDIDEKYINTDFSSSIAMVFILQSGAQIIPYLELDFNFKKVYFYFVS
jgi:hypothetical protein